MKQVATGPTPCLWWPGMGVPPTRLGSVGLPAARQQSGGDVPFRKWACVWEGSVCLEAR